MENHATFALDEVECFAEVDETLRQFWRANSSTRDADPDFTSFILGLNAEPDGLRCFVLRVEGQPVAMLVGRLEQAPCTLKLGHFKFAAPKLKTLLVPHGGWLGRIEGERAAQFIGALEHLLRSGEVEMVMLHGIDITSDLAKAARKKPHILCRDMASLPQIHRYLALDSCKSGFMSSLSGNERRQQLKRGRKLAERFEKVVIRRYSEPGEVAPLMALAERIACKSYQRRIGVGFTSDDRMRARLLFHAQANWLRGFVLFGDDRPIAFWIGCLRDGVFASDFLGFDPDFAGFSPGMYLTIEVIEALSQDKTHPVSQIDYGSGDRDYKRRLSTDFKEDACIHIFAPSPRLMALNAMRQCCILANEAAKSLLMARRSLRLGKAWPKLSAKAPPV